MQFMTVVAVTCLAAVSALGAHSTNEIYSEHFDVDSVLANHKLVENYINCCLNDDDRGCTGTGKDLKEILPHALLTICAECTPFQARRIRKVCNMVRKTFPDKWTALQRKYDKDGRSTKDLDAFLAIKD